MTSEENKNQEDQKTFQPEVVIENTPEELVPQPLTTEEEGISSPPPPVYFEENKNKYLFLGLGAIIFIFLFFLIISIFGRGKKSSKKVHLVYWGLWEEKEIFMPLIEKYQKENPQVTVEYIKMDPHEYREKILERSEKGKGPDIFRYHNTWVSSLKRVLAPLPKEIMKDEEYEKTFYPIVKKDLKIGKYYYGIPLEIDCLVLVYNDTLFKNVGIEKPPTNWEEVIDYAIKLTTKDANGQIITGGIALGTASNVEHFSDVLGTMFLQNGVDFKNIYSEEGASALAAFRKFAEPPNNVWDETMPNSIAAFIQEKVAMIIVPSWEILVIKQANPELKLKVSNFPIVPGGKPISLASYWVEGVSVHSKNQIEAWRFLKFLVSKENLTKLYENQAKTRLFGEPYSRVDLASLLIQNEYIGPVIAQANHLESLPVVSRTFDNGINDEIIKYLENAVNSTINGVSYKEALEPVQKGIDQVFKKYEIEI